MSYIDAFLQNATWLSILGIASILFLLRVKHVKFGRGKAFFEMAFGPPGAEAKAQSSKTITDYGPAHSEESSPTAAPLHPRD